MKLNFKYVAMALSLVASMAAYAIDPKPNKECEWLVYGNDVCHWGYYNPATGQTMYDGIFEYMPSSIIDGVMMVRDSLNLSVYSALDSASPRPLDGLSGLRSVGNVAEGMLPVCRPASRIEVYSVSASKAEPAFTLNPIDGKEIVRCSTEFRDGLLVITNEDGVEGAVDKTGRVIIPLKYGLLSSVGHGLLFVGSGDPDEPFEYAINTKGEEVFRFEDGWRPYGGIHDNGLIIAENIETQRTALIDTVGHRIVLPEGFSINGFCGDYASYTKWDGPNSIQGVLKIKGDNVKKVFESPVKWIALLPWDPTKFVCEDDNGNYAVMDLHGKKVIDFGDVQVVQPCYAPSWKGFIVMDGNNKYICLDAHGNRYDGEREFDYLEVPVYSLNSASLSGEIESCYLNIDYIVGKLCVGISADALCGYKLGSPVNQHIPTDFAIGYYIGGDFLTIRSLYPTSSSGIFSWTEGIQTKHVLAMSEDGLLLENPIESIVLSIEGPNDIWENIGYKVKECIESKGFVLFSESEYRIEYSHPISGTILTIDLEYSTWDTITITLAN